MIQDQAYPPFIFICPHPRSGSNDIFFSKEREGRLGSDNLDPHILILWQLYVITPDWSDCGRTPSSSLTINGAFTDATLPVVINRTCVKFGFRSASETKAINKSAWTVCGVVDETVVLERVASDSGTRASGVMVDGNRHHQGSLLKSAMD